MTAETRLIDYSYSRPKPADIKASGYVGVIRYLSGVRGKDLTKIEKKALHAKGLPIGIVWETTADRTKEGHAAGVADAQRAGSLAEPFGFPLACPIFFAVDFDAAPSQVQPYFDGVTSALKGHPVGIYGGIRVIDGVHGPTFRWQTAAWSAGRLSKRADIYQRVGHVAKPIPGGGYDENVVCTRLPMWGPDGVVVLTAPGVKRPKPHKHPKPIHFGLVRTRVFAHLTALLNSGRHLDADANGKAIKFAGAYQKQAQGK